MTDSSSLAEKSGIEVGHTTRRQFVTTSIAAASIATAAGVASAQDGRPKIIDAWGHVSLPRFMSAEEYISLLDSNGAEAAIVGTAATCPDLRELFRSEDHRCVGTRFPATLHERRGVYFAAGHQRRGGGDCGHSRHLPRPP